MTTDDISKQSLRTLCGREMERRGDYVQVSIFAKTILDLLEELATLRAQLDAVVGEKAELKEHLEYLAIDGRKYRDGERMFLWVHNFENDIRWQENQRGNAVVGQETAWEDGFNRCKYLAGCIVGEGNAFKEAIDYLDSVTAKFPYMPPLKAGK